MVGLLLLLPLPPSVRRIVCYFAFQKPRKTGREVWSTCIPSQNHVSLLDCYSIRSGKWLQKLLAGVLPPSSASLCHEDAGSNCLRNTSIICDTPWRHRPKYYRSTDPFSWHAFLLHSAIRFPFLVSGYLMTLYQLLSYISQRIHPRAAHSVRHTSRIPRSIILLGGLIRPPEHQSGKLLISTGNDLSSAQYNTKCNTQYNAQYNTQYSKKYTI